ncbi:MAG: adenylate/guanylate cyclase domain-containing protein [Pseudomonadota bacterium]|nr:adenylate/guanylate cyclase domain-containing protein [Pseudomonadota bacterium]
MTALWRGTFATRLRIASGLILFIYAGLHFLNIALGLVSLEVMHAAQDWRLALTRSLPGTVLLYGALIVHAGLALARMAARRTLRMPFWEVLQIALGLAIPFLLIVHIIFTRAAHELFAVNDRMIYLVALIFGTPDAWWQSALMLIVWTHGCLGLHFWLRITPRWRRHLPALTALAALVPVLSLAGFLSAGRQVAPVLADPEARAELMQSLNWPDGATFSSLFALDRAATNGFLVLLAVAAVVPVARKFLRRSRSLRVAYVEGPSVTSPIGPTLLEISRANGVPHTSLCGGRGRCTTCRVIVTDGAGGLPPPSDAEARSLAAVGAAPGTRLACQLRPTAALQVHRVFRPDGTRARAHSSLGRERQLAILFLDIRGFTARTTGQLPYDVVFLLNRFFDAIVPAITGAGGQIDKYLGDGLLAVFDTAEGAQSAKQALEATARIGQALERFNTALATEGAAPLRIGIGLHLGELVQGEIGATGHAPRTIIGETVNAASRLEAMTKELAAEALVSVAVLEAAGVDLSDHTILTLDLRGVAEPVQALALSRARDVQALGPTG